MVDVREIRTDLTLKLNVRLFVKIQAVKMVMVRMVSCLSLLGVGSVTPNNSTLVADNSESISQKRFEIQSEVEYFFYI